MNHMISSDRSGSQSVRGRVLLLVGAGLPVLGIIAYGVQIGMGRLDRAMVCAGAGIAWGCSRRHFALAKTELVRACWRSSP